MAPLLFLLLLKGAAAFTTIPSCLTANTTWDSSNITSFTPNIPTPELCQQLCLDSPPCQAITWASSDASPFPLSCYTFSTTTSRQECTHCVSGLARCSCSSQGLCQAEDDNIVDTFTGVALEQECSSLCRENGLCKLFTFFGDKSALRHSCILHSSCDTIVTSCTDCENCHTGPADCQVCSFDDTLPDGSCVTGQQPTGLLVIGGWSGDAARSVEFWSPGVTCRLPDFSRDMYNGPSVSFIQDTIVACYYDSCDKLQEGAWLKMADMRHVRGGHTGEVIDDSVLLIGGIDSPTMTELVTVSGQSVEGFSLDPGRKSHCSLKISDRSVVVIGGVGTESQVTEYMGLQEEVTSRELPDLLTGRWYHACGQYMDGETQVMIVAGGKDSSSSYLSSSEVYQYPGGAAWRAMADLPSPRAGLLGASLAGVFHLLGGADDKGIYLDDILAYDISTSTFRLAGHLTTTRYSPAVTEVPWQAVAQYCNNATVQRSEPTL